MTEQEKSNNMAHKSNPYNIENTFSNILLLLWPRQLHSVAKHILAPGFKC